MKAKAEAIVSKWQAQGRGLLASLSLITLLALAQCEAEPAAMAARVVMGA